MNTVTRRDFLKLSTAAGLAAATAPLASLAATAAGPFHRAGQPRLRLSLAAYTFRETFPIMRGKPNTKVPAGKAIDMFKFIDYCAAHGCEGTELTSYFFAEETDEYLIKLRRHCFLTGIAVSGTAIGNNFSHPKGPKLDAEIAMTKKWIDRALVLGAPHIRVFAGVTKEIPRAEADKQVIRALEECGDYASKRGIFLGLENHDSIGTADTLIPMIKAVNNPWVGINLDSGNFRTADPYKDFAECVPYSVNVQYKVEIGHGTPAGARPADLKRFTRLLRDGGYRGWVALEYEAKEDPATAVPRLLKEMREMFAG
ncbi:MAG: sugar phosphate isomerase/epimerase [Verrucomicrobia bacterium]|nr:sugar phosphate isomerase/epimerase [Verrucomicrobiota bacterium]